jgi:hypothetical protein
MLLLGLSIARAEETKKMTDAELKAHAEMHEKMADAHKAAADCVKSKKDIEVCRADFHKAVEGVHGDMDGMGMGPHGKMCAKCKDGKKCEHCKGKDMDCEHCKGKQCEKCKDHKGAHKGEHKAE